METHRVTLHLNDEQIDYIFNKFLGLIQSEHENRVRAGRIRQEKYRAKLKTEGRKRKT